MNPTVAVSRRRLTAATAIQGGTRIVSALLGVVVAASLARSLSRPAFGDLALALTIVSLAGSLTDLGINNIAVREMARRPADRASIAGALSMVQLLTGMSLAILGCLVTFALMPGGAARVMSVFVVATLPLGAITSLTMASQARLRPELVIIPSLIQSVVWLAVVLILSVANSGLALYGVGFLGAGITQAAITLVISARVTEVSFRGARPLIGRLLRLSWPIGLAGVFVTAYYRIDGVLLFHYRGATPTAYYSASYRVLDVLQLIPMTLSGVLLPLLAAAGRGSDAKARAGRVFELTATILLGVAIPIAVCGSVLAPGLVALVYGSAYRPSIVLLQILLPAFVPICAGYLLTSQLVVHGELRPYVVVAAVGATVNIAANLVLIPRYGAYAAAWTTLVTELLSMLQIAWVVRRRLGLVLPVTRLLRCTAAAAASGVLVWLVRDAPLIAGLAVGVVSYPVATLGLRAISIDELRSLLSRQLAATA